MATKLAPETRILRLPEVLYRVGIGRSTRYKLIAAGEFPAPVKLAGNAVGWLCSEVEEWITCRPRMGKGLRK